MDTLHKGTEIKIKPGVFYQGFDLSNTLAVVVDTESYILATSLEYELDRIKLFRHEFTIAPPPVEEDPQYEEYLMDLFDMSFHP